MIAVTQAASFQQASIDYRAVLPLLIVFGTALVGVLVEAFVSRRSRYRVQVPLTIIGLVAALVAVVAARDHKTLTAGVGDGAGSSYFALSIDSFTLFIQGALIVMAILSVLIMAERFDGESAEAFTPSGATTPGSPGEAAALRAGLVTTEVFPLTLFAVLGMLLFPAVNDLLGMFVALEVLSLPLYILTGLARRRRLLSQEAALKYFLLGSFSSAFFLMGAALIYGYAGSVTFAGIAEAATRQSSDFNGLLVPGALLLFMGLLFKVGAAPFHMWTPDVYQGAPTAVTGFMAACTKAAAFGAILRLAYVGLEGVRWEWMNAVIIVAILTMVTGSVLSVAQTDVKRLLAYSSIAHAGFILVAVLAFHQTAIAGVLFYVVVYGLSTIGAFGLATLVRRDGVEASDIHQWAGIGRRHPVVALAFSFLMLAFAGIPLTSGFVAKFAAFAPAVAHGGATGTVMVVVGVLCSAITVFVYVRLIVLMFFHAPTEETAEVVMPSAATTFAIALCVLATLVFGVVPSTLLDAANTASTFLR